MLPIPPLQQSNKGAAVQNLQLVLAFFVQKTNDPAASALFKKQNFIMVWATELHDQMYGKATAALVSIFQKKFNIKSKSSGNVDAPTAERFNVLLKEFGVRDGQPDGNQPERGEEEVEYTVSGTVLNQRKEPIPDQTLVAYDVDLVGAAYYRTLKTTRDIYKKGGMEKLGTATSDKNGNFNFKFKKGVFIHFEIGAPDVVVYAVDKDQVAGASPLSMESDWNGTTNLQNWNVLLTNKDIRGATEYALLTAAVKPFVEENKLSLYQLADSADQQLFLANETNQNADHVSVLVTAFKLVNDHPNKALSTQLLYGIGREGLSLDWTSLLTTPKQTIQGAIVQAGVDNIISVLPKETITAFVDQLAGLAVDMVFKKDAAGKPTPLAAVLQLATDNPDLQKSFLTLHQNFEGTAKEFWTAFLPKQDGFKDKPALIQKLQLTNQLSIVSGQHLPLVQTLLTKRKIKQPSDLLDISSADLKALILKAGVPDFVEGASDDEKAAALADTIKNLSNAAFATPLIARMVAQKTVPNISGLVSEFFAKAPDFDFSHSRIVDFDKTIREIAKEEAPQVKKQLGLLQRIYNVSPTPAAMTTLLKKGFQSARQIATMSRNTFVNNYSRDLGGDDLARAVHNRAVVQNLRSQQIALRVQELSNRAIPLKIAGDAQMDKALDTVKSAIASYPDLFSRPDVCECKNCLSIYSPASYFVDIMQMADNIPVTGGGTVLSMLLKRRPDLQYLLLTCENTNTLIPYIDLVNEVMEYYVTHWNQATGIVDVDPATVAHDTGSALAPELRSNPQYINQQSYKTLYETSTYPFTLPYHQPLDTISIYLDFLKTSRAALMEVFTLDINNPTAGRPTAINPAAIQSEGLGLTLREYSILTGKDYDTNAAALKSAQEYYGFAAPPANYIDTLRQVPEFLQRVGLRNTELVDILGTQFINPGQNVVMVLRDLFGTTLNDANDLYKKLKDGSWKADGPINTILGSRGVAQNKMDDFLTANFPAFQKLITLYNSTDGCGLDTTSLQSVQWVYEHTAPGDPDAALGDPLFWRLHRFIRLWRKMGYSVHELDTLIGALKETDVTDKLLAKLAVAKKVNQTLDLPILKLAALWGNIDTYGDQSLYSQLFLKKTGRDQTNNLFTPNPLGDILSGAGTTITDNLTAILSAFQITSDEFAAIAKAAGMNPDTTSVTVAALSTIYRYKLLSDALDFPIADLCLMKTLFAVDPFAEPAATDTFVALISQLTAANIDATTLYYILTAQGNLFPLDKMMQSVVLLKDRMLALSTDDLRLNAVIGEIASLTGIDEQSLRVISDPLTTSLIANLSKTGLNANYFSDLTLTTLAFSQTDARIDFAWDGSPRPGSLTPGNYSVRWDGWIAPISSDDYTFTVRIAEKGDTVRLWINGISVLDTTADLVNNTWQIKSSLVSGQAVAIRLEYLSKHPKSEVHLLWETRTIAQTTVDAGFFYTALNLSAILDTLTLCHRNALLVNGLTLSLPELNYLTLHATDFGSIDFSNLKVKDWQTLCRYTDLRKLIPASSLLSLFQQAIAEDATAPGNPPSDALLSAIAKATNWNKAALVYLTKLYFTYSAKDFKNEIAFGTLQKAFTVSKSTGIAIGDHGLPAWVPVEGAHTNFDDLYGMALDIKNAVRAKYTDKNWTKISRQLNDKLREHQKKALSAFLLTDPYLKSQGVTNLNQLYEYLLIDVQMEACMDSSRIIQGTMALRQYIDRGILNLEVSRGVPANAFSDDDREKWEWMKHYPVEAAWKKLCVDTENYLDETLRDDKTPFFKDMESELQKGDITPDSALLAFQNYLFKLNEVSNPEILATLDDNEAQKTHVFARTHTAPYAYFYRFLDRTGAPDQLRWSPWETVQLDIKSIDDGFNSGTHLVPLVYNKRLFLFLPEFSPRQVDKLLPAGNLADQGNRNSADLKQQTYWEIRIGWSEYAGSKWTPKKISKESLSPFYTDWVNIWQSFNSSQLKANQEITRQIQSLQQVIDLQNQFLADHPEYADAINYANAKLEAGITSLQATYYPLSDMPTVKPKDFIFNTNIYQGQVAIGVYIRTSYLDSLADFGGDTNPVYLGSFVLPDIQSKPVTDFSDSNEYRYIEAFKVGLDDTADYEPFFQSYEKVGPLSLAGVSFLDNPSIVHRVHFSNDVKLTDFEDNLKYPFFYSDVTLSRVYFAIPLIPTIIYQLKNPDEQYFQPFLNHEPPLVKQKFIPPSMRVEMLAKSTRPVEMKMSALRPGADQALLDKMVHIDLEKNFNVPSSFGGAMANFVPYPRVSGGVLAFYNFRHPFTPSFIKKLNNAGVAELEMADTAEFKMDPNCPWMDVAKGLLANDAGAFFNYYQPEWAHVKQYAPGLGLPNYYIDCVDEHDNGALSIYNKELFFHAPLYIATRLSKNGKYADALTWFHYIFNPMSTEPPLDATHPNTPYWGYLPFKTTPDESITQFLDTLVPGYNHNQTVREWREKPFQPFVIARDRPIAFMKNVVMAYLDNLIAWADDLYRSFTRENITEATQIYTLALDILGPAQEFIPDHGAFKAKSYADLKPILDDFGDARVDLENLFPFSSDIPPSPTSATAPFDLLGIIRPYYFCIPANDKLLGYWKTIGNRLFNIRHCRNIEGIEQPLPLYEPPLDPALLISAFAQGLDIGSILADLETPEPLYRFSFLSQKTREFIGQVNSFSNAMLSACEKSDGEAMARLRSTQEIKMLGLVKQVKERQLLEAKANRDSLVSSRITAVKRFGHYVVELVGNANPDIPDTPELPDELTADTTLPVENIIPEVSTAIDVSLASTDERGVKIIPKEKLEQDKSQDAMIAQATASGMEGLAAIFHLLPSLGIALQPWGIGSENKVAGGDMVANALSAAARVPQILGSVYSYQASQAGKMASYIRREQDWVFQANMTAREIIQLDKQITAAEIRVQTAQKELDNHEQQIENTQGLDDLLHMKFTNQELYDWMKDRLYDVHKQSYQLAYNLAKKTEKAYRLELGLDDSNFIQYGYFVSANKGITAGEQLQLAMDMMESSYIEKNEHVDEITLSFSLLEVNPQALLDLKSTGMCTFGLFECFYDVYCPGEFMRLIKGVRLSLLCIAGPYTNVSARLTMTAGYVRKADNLSVYLADLADYPSPACTAMTTSTAQNDGGIFEFNFRDERYLPFEGGGGASDWRLQLPQLRAFNYDSIGDAILHVSFYAKTDPDFRTLVETPGNIKAALNKTKGLSKLINMKQDFSQQFYNLLHPPVVAGNQTNQTVSFDITENHFPYYQRDWDFKITGATVYLKPKDKKAIDLTGLQQLQINAQPVAPANTWNAVNGMQQGAVNLNGSPKISWTIDTQNLNGFDEGTLDNVFILFGYSIL